LRRVNLANLCIGPLILLGSYGLSRRRRNQPPTGLRYHRTTTALRSQPFCGPKGERLLLARASATRRGARFISRLFDSDLSSGQEVAQGCGSGARSIARGITTVFTVLAGASELVGDLIRRIAGQSWPPGMGGLLRCRCTHTQLHRRPPACAASPTSDDYLNLNLSDHPNAIGEGLDKDRLRIINLTSLRLWITARRSVEGAVRCSCERGTRSHGRLVVSADDAGGTTSSGGSFRRTGRAGRGGART